MYIPPEFRMHDAQEAVRMIHKYPFGLLITQTAEGPLVTHVPFVLIEHEDCWVLETHLSRDNPQAQLADGDEALVVFSGPQAYISPSLYTQTQNVPTWNYVAVHVRGSVGMCREEDQLLPLLERSIQAHEPAFMEQWHGLSLTYINRLLHGIVGVHIEVNRWEGVVKVSQNKSLADQAQILSHLSIHPQQSARDLIPYMIQHIQPKH